MILPLIIGSGRATVVGLAFGPDGLYFTDLCGEAGFDSNGMTQANVYRISYDSSTKVRDESATPAQFTLRQNYPNPFNPTTLISYELAKSSNVELTIYNQLGQAVKTLVNKRQHAGAYRIGWGGRNKEGVPVVSGAYFYSLKAGAFNQTRKLLLLR